MAEIGGSRVVEPAERDELVGLVRRIQAGGPEEEIDAFRSLQGLVLHPRVSDLISWPQYAGFGHDLTAEEVVEVALAYEPFAV